MLSDYAPVDFDAPLLHETIGVPTRADAGVRDVLVDPHAFPLGMFTSGDHRWGAGEKILRAHVDPRHEPVVDGDQSSADSSG